MGRCALNAHRLSMAEIKARREKGLKKMKVDRGDWMGKRVKITSVTERVVLAFVKLIKKAKANKEGYK